MQPVLVKHGVVGIGPYMRAYERQEFRSKWADPPAGLMTQVRSSGNGARQAVLQLSALIAQHASLHVAL